MAENAESSEIIENVTLSRKRERLIHTLVLGSSIVNAAKAIGITEQTAYRWLKEPLVKAEKARLEAEIREAEQAEIERILTTGYAALHKRIESLDRLARSMEEPFTSPDTGKTYHLRNSPDHIREWRGLLDDIAKELGQRVKKQEVTGKDGGPIEYKTDWGGGILEEGNEEE